MAEPANCYDLCEAPTPGSAPTAALSSLKIPSSVEGHGPGLLCIIWSPIWPLDRSLMSAPWDALLGAGYQ